VAKSELFEMLQSASRALAAEDEGESALQRGAGFSDGEVRAILGRALADAKLPPLEDGGPDLPSYELPDPPSPPPAPPKPQPPPAPQLPLAPPAPPAPAEAAEAAAEATAAGRALEDGGEGGGGGASSGAGGATDAGGASADAAAPNGGDGGDGGGGEGGDDHEENLPAALRRPKRRREQAGRYEPTLPRGQRRKQPLALARGSGDARPAR